jgi:hypothetical protein
VAALAQPRWNPGNAVPQTRPINIGRVNPGRGCRGAATSCVSPGRACSGPGAERNTRRVFTGLINKAPPGSLQMVANAGMQGTYGGALLRST